MLRSLPQLVCTLALLAGASAQTFINIDDSPTGFGNCGLSCAGGTGSATAPFQTFGNASPSLDGGSMNLGFTGPTLTGGQTTNYLWYWNAGPNANVTTFVSTWNIYVPSLSLIQALEFDTKQFQSGHRWFWGSECDTGGFWRIWNQLGGAWVTTTVSCALTAATWHSIVWRVHRVAGDTSCASSEPCDYYDSLTVDGVNVTPGGGFTPQPSGSSGDADNTGIDTQIDMNSTGGTTSAFYDEMSYVQSQGTQSAPASAMLASRF